jgi:hypothetical protein
MADAVSSLQHRWPRADGADALRGGAGQQLPQDHRHSQGRLRVCRARTVQHLRVRQAPRRQPDRHHGPRHRGGDGPPAGRQLPVGCLSNESDQKRQDIRAAIANSYVQNSRLQDQMFGGADRYGSFGFMAYIVEPDFTDQMPVIRVSMTPHVVLHQRLPGPGPSSTSRSTRPPRGAGCTASPTRAVRPSWPLRALRRQPDGRGGALLRRRAAGAGPPRPADHARLGGEPDQALPGACRGAPHDRAGRGPRPVRRRDLGADRPCARAGLHDERPGAVGQRTDRRPQGRDQIDIGPFSVIQTDQPGQVSAVST